MFLVPADDVSGVRTASRDAAALLVPLFVALGIAAFFVGRRARTTPWLRRALSALLPLAVFFPLHVNLSARAEGMLNLPIYREEPALDLTLVDVVALALFFAQWGSRSVGPLRIPRLFYLVAVIGGVAVSAAPFVSSFVLWKLLRMYFVFGVMAATFAEEACMEAALAGFAFGVIFQVPLVMYQVQIAHVPRPYGSLGSSNVMSLMMNFLAPIFFSLVLAGKRTALMSLALLSICFCQLVGKSRAGTILLGFTIACACVGSLVRQVTRRKFRIVAGGGVGAAVLLSAYLPALLKRFDHFRDAPWIGRMKLKAAATAIIEDHPFGVGPNMLCYTMNNGGYAYHAGVDHSDRSWIVHNIYYAVTAEIGFLGLAAFVVVVVAVVVSAARAAFAREWVGDVGLGIFVGMLAFVIHSFAEMAGTLRQPSYGFWILAAMACAIVARKAGGLPRLLGDS